MVRGPVAGKNKGIVDSPIVLTVYASHCPDLSLIDLPGITRVPLKGSDQSDDIETLTRQMALRSGLYQPSRVEVSWLHL